MPGSDFDKQHGYYLEDLSVGMTAKTITDADENMYTAVSGVSDILD